MCGSAVHRSCSSTDDPACALDPATVTRSLVERSADTLWVSTYREDSAAARSFPVGKLRGLAGGSDDDCSHGGRNVDGARVG